MKTLAILAFTAGLIAAGAASAHPHFMPPNQTGAADGKTTSGIVGGYDIVGKSGKTGDGAPVPNNHDGSKLDRRKLVVLRLEEQVERLKSQIAGLKFDLIVHAGNPDRIKHEIARLERELLKVGHDLRKDGMPA